MKHLLDGRPFPTPDAIILAIQKLYGCSSEGIYRHLENTIEELTDEQLTEISNLMLNFYKFGGGLEECISCKTHRNRSRINGFRFSNLNASEFFWACTSCRNSLMNNPKKDVNFLMWNCCNMQGVPDKIALIICPESQKDSLIFCDFISANANISRKLVESVCFELKNYCKNLYI